jgi:hypothetical protein
VPDLENDMTELYLGNVLNAFEGGVQMDLRLRLAIEFLKEGYLTLSDPELAAANALGCATELIRIAAERGLMKPLPEDDELNQPLKTHIRRNIRAQLYQQSEAQRIGQAEQPRVSPANGVPPGIARS